MKNITNKMNKLNSKSILCCDVKEEMKGNEKERNKERKDFIQKAVFSVQKFT